MARLTKQYDGYRFTGRNQFDAMYNPFSVLNALSKSFFDNYWFASGTPTFLVEMLKQTDFDLRDLDGIEVGEFALQCDTSSSIPILYQSGYLTIKDYDREFHSYTLGYPNDEVKSELPLMLKSGT
jgi:hypothetical protein